MASSNLLRNTLVYTIGNFGSKILSFLLIPLYSYFLSKSELGTYDLLLTTVQLLLPIVSLQMNEAVYRWLLDCKSEEEKTKVIRQTIFILCVSFVVIELLIFITGFFIAIPYQFEFSLLLFTSSLLPFSQQMVRGLGKTKIYSIAGILNSLMIFLFSLFFLFSSIFEDKVKGIFYALFLSNIFTIIFLGISSKISFKNNKNFKVNLIEYKVFVYYSFPLVLNALSWWLINASGRYTILHFMSIEDNGIYAISS